MSRTVFPLELRPRLPAALRRLETLADNLAYSWDRTIRDQFRRLDPALWRSSGWNPRLFLRRLPQETLDRAAADPAFVKHFERVVAGLDARLKAPPAPELAGHLDPARDRVAYFCAEFGLHETLPIYSGGLGVLAGDHLKASSDLGVPLVAVGLLYRQGYFTQTLDAQGRQHAHAHTSDFDDLPLRLCRDGDGEEQRVMVEVAEHQVQLRIWRACVGRVPLILLDADVPENGAAERAITHQLYGGDADTRIRQEIVLGIGGLRALRKLAAAAAGRGPDAIPPTVFHFNEGHAAFVILERIREQVAAGLPFEAALEAVAAAHVFTTHTPVAAGHDQFQNGQLRWFLRALLPQLGAPEERVLALGTAGAPVDPHQGRFNMTTLALHGSRFHNGVSRIHGRVARSMERALWPQVRVGDNPIGHVTNGVHLHTFLAGHWVDLFDERLPGWRDHLLDAPYWRRLDDVPDAEFAAVRRKLKQALLADVAERIGHQLKRNHVPERTARQVTRFVRAGDTDVLVLGFARRFATYKRATLLLADEARLARILGNPDRPALLLFAGKAHPRDHPGQGLIQQLYQASLKPELIGRLIVVEGYDLALARRLVQGCDVWLNNPEYPLEACGTSGQKAGINGAVNVSVRDGWWDEGYVAGGPDGPNGFAVAPADLRFWESLGSDEQARRKRDEEECAQLLDILEQEVAPLYYGEKGGDDGAAWRRIARNSMKTLIPRYNSARQVMDYARELYAPAARHGRTLADADAARALAEWKRKVRAAWPGVRLRLPAAPPATLHSGEKLPLKALASLNGLSPQDVAVECELGRRDGPGSFVRQKIVALAAGDPVGEEHLFKVDLEPLAGAQQYRIRMRPQHPHLAHPFEVGLAVWA